MHTSSPYFLASKRISKLNLITQAQIWTQYCKSFDCHSMYSSSVQSTISFISKALWQGGAGGGGGGGGGGGKQGHASPLNFVTEHSEFLI